MTFYYSLTDLDNDKATIFKVSADNAQDAENKLFSQLFPYINCSGNVSDINAMLDISEHKVFKVCKEIISI